MKNIELDLCQSLYQQARTNDQTLNELVFILVNKGYALDYITEHLRRSGTLDDNSTLHIRCDMHGRLGRVVVEYST